jgi:hypothetical protein
MSVRVSDSIKFLVAISTLLQLSANVIAGRRQLQELPIQPQLGSFRRSVQQTSIDIGNVARSYSGEAAASASNGSAWVLPQFGCEQGDVNGGLFSHCCITWLVKTTFTHADTEPPLTGYLALNGPSGSEVYTLTLAKATASKEDAGHTLTLSFAEGIPHDHLANGKLMRTHQLYTSLNTSDQLPSQLPWPSPSVRKCSSC